MADYTRERAINLWFAFDQMFLFNRPPAVSQAIAAAYPDGVLNDLVDIAKSAVGDEDIAERVAGRKTGLLTLAEIQCDILNDHLPEPQDLQRAFEDFGQGVLFDDHNPRPPTRRIHMMDGTPNDWVGYHRWYAFGRTAIALGADRHRWSRLLRNISLAWAIQSEAEPQVDRMDNPGLPPERLLVLKRAWQDATDAALSNAYLSYTGPFRRPNLDGQVKAPAPESLEFATPREMAFKDVQRILDFSAGMTNPIHGGEGRFWNKPLADFASDEIYGEAVIATEGENRGARSGLVRVLRGQLANFPQMPLNRSPLSTEQIDAIEKWIDVGCPE